MPDVLTSGVGAKPAVLMLITDTLVLRDFENCGALALLAQKYQIDFMFTNPEIAPKLEPFGSPRYRYSSPAPRFWLWNIAWTIGYRKRFQQVVPRMNREFYNRKTSGRPYWHWTQQVGEVLLRLGLGKPVMALTEWFLSRTVRMVMGAASNRSYAAVVIPTGLRDVAAEDLVRWARRARVPSIAIQANWDCFNLKLMLALPDHMLLWGEQSWYFARFLQRMPHSSLEVIGSQRHDHFFGGLPDREAARAQLGVESHGRILLFCGALSPFDELGALHQIDDAITAGSLPRDIHVLYKRHPGAKSHNDNDRFDPKDFKHVSPVAFHGSGVWNALDEYKTILRAADATISPYSTMGLESALCGRPTLSLGYHPDPGLPYWRYAREYLHLQSYRFAGWAICCHRQEDLVDAISRLLSFAGDPDMERIAMESTRHVVYRDALTYRERLLLSVEALIAGVRSDAAVTAAEGPFPVSSGHFAGLVAR